VELLFSKLEKLLLFLAGQSQQSQQSPFLDVRNIIARPHIKHGRVELLFIVDWRRCCSLYQVRANKEIYTYKEVARKEGRKER
jgi:hypothetical protein